MFDLLLLFDLFDLALSRFSKNMHIYMYISRHKVCVPWQSKKQKAENSKKVSETVLNDLRLK